MDTPDSAHGFSGWMRWFWRKIPRGRGEADPVAAATEHAVQVADPTIRQARRYRQVLHDPIDGAMRYFRALTDGLPGPVLLDRSRYYDDPTVKALFASPEALEELLRSSPEINLLRKQGIAGEVSAMLTMEQQERTIFGHKQEGELIIRDARQQAVSFSGHRIIGAAFDPVATRTGIVNRGIEVLATVAMERITTLRARKAELTGKREYLKGMRKILDGRSHRQEMFATPSAKDREELRKVEQYLVEVNQELDGLQGKIPLPEQSLGCLEEVMRAPERMLTVRTERMRLDWKGVRMDDAPGSDANEITLAEFSMEELRRSAVLVTFSLAASPTV